MKVQFILLLFLISTLFGCHKTSSNPIPDIAFDYTIDMTLPSYSNLMGVGGYAYMTGGSRGIVIYHRSVDVFVAFDRQSPEDADATCGEPLYCNPDNFLELIDSCSDARFSLYDGSPISGSNYGLRQYQTLYSGGNTLRIYN